MNYCYQVLFELAIVVCFCAACSPTSL